LSNTTAQVAPGQLFNVPGVPGGETEYFDQWEDTYQLAVTMSQANQVTVNGITKFRQTDIVFDWELELTVTETITQGTGATLAASAYAPHNLVGPVRLPIQNQYASVDVPNGIDLWIFDLIRPYYQQGQFPLMGANPFGDPAGSTALGYPAVGNAAPNPVWPAQWTLNSGVAKTYTLDYRIPASQYFDVYYDRAITGEATSPPHSAYVSPQYMAGTTRNILPQVKLNAGFGTTLDNSPANSTPIGSPPSTYIATGLLTFRRYGVFAGNPAAAPLEYPWQYRRFATQYGVGNQSLFSVDIPQETGQLMAWFIRFFDPLGAGGLGAAVPLSTINEIQFLYGSGLFRFDGTPMELYRRWLRQKNVMLPPGVIAFDLAQTEAGLITNEKLLNTLTTAGMRIRVLFNTNPSTASYAVLGLESLVYVT
jgi:hypothetical protein